MTYYIVQPSPKLAEIVRCFWVLEGEASENHPYIHRSMADGCAELVFHYSGIFDELLENNHLEKSFRSGLSGQSQLFRRFSVKQNFGIFGVYLYPFAITQCFSYCGTEVRNQMIDLNTLLGAEGTEIEEKIMLARTNHERVSIISEFLERKLLKVDSPRPGVFEAIKDIIHASGTSRVDELAKKNAVSTRQFERNFKHFSGFSPKLFSRITRFQRALVYYKDRGKSLTEIGYDCGYYDQSHFIQDFKEFSGYNPKEYFAGRAEGAEWREV